MIVFIFKQEFILNLRKYLEIFMFLNYIDETTPLNFAKLCKTITVGTTISFLLGEEFKFSKTIIFLISVQNLAAVLFY